MRIGPLEFRFAEKKPDLDERGGTGTAFFTGVLSEEEYNRDLQGSKGLIIYDKMRRSDGQVKAVLSACELPLRAATWNVEPASDEAKDQEVAEFVESNLFNMAITWDSFLKHVMLDLSFGFSPFEKVWEIVDGQVRYKKLAPRLPKTLYRWILDDNGGLLGMEQSVWKGDSYQFITIPVEKLLVFTNEKEGSNYEGISVLRAAYKHWYYKDQLYRIDGIAAERHATGVPYFKYPQTATTADKAALDAIGQRLQAHEAQYVRTSNDYEFTIQGLTGTIRDIMPSIDHHNRMIAQSILADFLCLGSGESGSWALSKDKSSFFLMSLRAVATNICDTMNQYAIKPLVDYNFNVDAYPKLTMSNLETREASAYAKAITDAITSGGITTGDDVEDALRDLLQLPAKEAAEKQAKAVPVPAGLPAQPVAQAKPGSPEETAANIVAGEKLNGIQITAAMAVLKDFINGAIPAAVALELIVAVGIDRDRADTMIKACKSFNPAPQPASGSSFKEFKRELTAAEKYVAFSDISQEMDSAEGKFVTAARPVVDKQIANIVDAAQKVVESKDPGKVTDLDIRYKRELADAIQGVLSDIFTYGRKQVKRELTAQTGAKFADSWPEPLGPDDIATIKKLLATRAALNAADIANKLRMAASFEVLRQIKAGQFDKAALLTLLADLIEKVLTNAAGYSISEAFNFGRSVEADADAEQWESAQYSAILDDNTCPVCAKLDGEEWPYDDPRTDQYAGGNPDCDGGGRCRCLLVYIAKTERRNPNG